MLWPLVLILSGASRKVLENYQRQNYEPNYRLPLPAFPFKKEYTTEQDEVIEKFMQETPHYKGKGWRR